MRICVVTESFLPQVNGVANSVRHVVDRLGATGHQALVVAPGPGPREYAGAEVVRVRSLALPGYQEFPLGLPGSAVERAMARFAPDVVHLASPVALGVTGQRAARRLGVPTVAVYQTDVAGFARHYPHAFMTGHAERVMTRWLARIHRRADRNLVPSRASHDQLAALGVTDLHLWRRGVSLDLFDPRRRSPQLRRRWADEGQVLVGYVGRLAAEKQVHRLAELADLPGVRLVVVGDGPVRGQLQRMLPGAVFTGMLRGEELAAAFASLDVFVHTGENETFCQTVQEAQASGVAVVAPGVGGPADLVEHGRTGLLHDPAEPDSLRDLVSWASREPALRMHLAANARQAVAGRTWAAVVDELVGHYREVCGQDVARAA
ncbi:glycosyltransferase family 1 protein [Nocardioides mangrovicus]|uniref:Glycosyltransferase family 1 protein n=1 Tax=Nocardioides mangrovicus TaxID=2478913 RepID=A0A3L8P3U3_9ACTN|nr:glycosyltransferase family 1 protein [Nocardioides mangrovicus]RLV49098.1 glycosyltransferase family 1 protein [Nocardioides mangrovicus]